MDACVINVDNNEDIETVQNKKYLKNCHQNIVQVKKKIFLFRVNVYMMKHEIEH